MYKQSDAALTAWRATERTLDAKAIITDSSGNSTEYSTSDITSIAYDSGAWTGDTFSVGSTYENNITVTFAHLVEGLKQGYKVTAKIGIKLPDGTYEYCPLGVFIISDEITMDRNNDATTIKAYDQFCVMQGTYTSKLTYPAKITDVIAEIANMSGVELNTDDIAELPTQADLASAISGQNYCTAIGWIAQFYGGFALFDRDGKLTIRTVTDASYILDASQYEQSGLTKNEATYQIGGMSVSVTTSTTDSTGESSETTSTLTAGETTGSQIELTNNVMTQTRLDSIWSTIKDITFYPYSLTWFGNPAVEAGDWLTLKDTKGNSFNVPNNSYTMTFDGGLTATSKADQTSTSSSSYSYSGTLSQTVKELAGRIGATGNYIYGTDTTQEPNTAKIGDQWYKQNGNKVELWQYVRQSDGSGKWTLIVSDLTSVEISANVDKAMSDADTATKNANTAVEVGNQALTKAQTAIDAANTAADNASTANANASTALNNAAVAVNQAQSAASDATSATNIANAVQQTVTDLKDGSTMTIAELENGLALKITKDDMNTALQPYATQSWTSTEISATADEINSSIASVKKTADGNTTDVTSLKQRADGFDTSISNLSTNKADQTWTTNQIKASADSLNVTIASVQTQVDNSAVGTNLLLNSGNGWVGDPSQSPRLPDSSIVVNGAIVTNSDRVMKITAPDSGEFFYRFSNPDTSNTLYGLTAGQTYTISGLANLTNGQLNFRAQTVNGSGGWNSFTGSQSGDLGVTNSDGTTFTKFSYTFTIPSVATGIYISLQAYNVTYNTSVLSFKQLKLELGSHATDYSANPADNATVTSVTAISATVNGLQTTVSKKVDNDTYQTQITQFSNQIATKVESSTYNSKMTQLDNAISSKVSSSDYNSKVTQLSDAINLKVSTADWQNSAVGINLVPNSNADASQIAWAGSTHLVKHAFYYSGTRSMFELDNSSTAESTGSSPRFYIQGGTKYTLSFYAFASNNMSGLDVWLLGRPAGNTTDGYTVAQQLVTNVNPSPSGTQYYSITFTCNSAIGNAYLRFDNNGSTNGNNAVLFWNEVKIETGSTATPWCPAASEIANYSQIQQLSDNINLRVQKNDVINQINVSSEGILIDGAKVHITGTTTIDNAVIKSAMIDSISADKITAGTLNAANVNVINLNANNITSGTISGDKINGGTITGVSFHQSSSGHNTWIDENGIHDYDGSGNNAWIKQGILQVYDNANQGFIMDAGSIKLTSINNYQTNATDMYGSIQRNSNLFDASTYGMDIIGSNGLVMRTNNATGIKLSSSAMLGTSIVGSFIGLSNNGKAVIGLQKDIQIFAGSSYTSVGGLTVKPVFYLGTNAWQGEGVDDGSNAYLAGAGITLDAAGSITLNIGHNKRIYWGTNHQDSTDGHSFFTTNSSGYYFWGGDTSSYQSIHVQSVSQSSLLSLKTNLNKLDPAQALAILNDTDIYSYNYKSDLKNGISKTYATAVIDDVNTKPQYNTPYDFISADGTGRDDGTILGYAVAAIQELNSKITSLETEIKQLKGAA